MAEPIVGTPAIVGFGGNFDRNGMDVGLAALLMAQSLGRDHADISRDVQIASHNVEESVEANAKAGELATEKTGASTLLAVEKTAAAGLLATKVSELATANQFAIAALTAATNTAALQASIAACCCETKALIIEKANATDALIREFRLQDVQGALQQAQARALALEMVALARAA